MAVLHGYFDDSGTHRGSECIVLAGLLSRVDEWGKFNEQWQAALDDYGLAYFHMADFVGGYREYEDWEPAVKRQRLQRLLSIIKSNTIASVGVGVPGDVFDEDYQQLRISQMWSKPFSMAMMLCMGMMADALEQGRREAQVPSETWISYRLEDGTKGKQEILRTYEMIKKNPRLLEDARILSIGFEPKRKVLPLQAADILAHQLYKRFTCKTEQPESLTLDVLRSNPHKWVTVEANHIRELAARMEEQYWADLKKALQELA